MIINFKCENCFFQSKCVAYKKLSPFSENARTDLGVEIQFVSCNNYMSTQDEGKEEEI